LNTVRSEIWPGEFDEDAAGAARLVNYDAQRQRLLMVANFFFAGRRRPPSPPPGSPEGPPKRIVEGNVMVGSPFS
jgi:hypothetical protein